VAVTPGGTRVYVTDQNANDVSVISTASNTVTDTIPVGDDPRGIDIGVIP
jgi:YVTN family beta-propeller protein